MKSNVFSKGTILFFILILSNNLFAISENTMRILKEPFDRGIIEIKERGGYEIRTKLYPPGIKVVDSKGNIHILVEEKEEYYGKVPVPESLSVGKWFARRAIEAERDTIFYTYELLDSLGNVIVPKRRLCQAKQGGHFLRGEGGKGLLPELKPSGPIIVGGSRSGFDSKGMLRIMELDKTGNIKKMYRPRSDCASFNLLWNGKELFYLNSTGHIFIIYKQMEKKFKSIKIELADLGIKKIGMYNYYVSKDFGSFLTEDGNIIILMRSTDPDDFDRKVHEKYDVSGFDIIGVFIVSQDGEIVSPMKKYNMKNVAFKKFTIVEEFTDGVPRLAQKGIGRRIVKKDTTVYAYFRGYDPQTKKIDIYQLRLTPEGDMMKSKSLETEMIKPLEELPSGFPIYHAYFASYAFDDKGDMYILYKDLKK